MFSFTLNRSIGEGTNYLYQLPIITTLDINKLFVAVRFRGMMLPSTCTFLFYVLFYFPSLEKDVHMFIFAKNIDI